MKSSADDLKRNEATDAVASNDVNEKSFFGVIIHSFFVIPFLIVIFSVLLFAAVRILTMEQHTIYDYLSDVKTGSLSKRWQSAFELSKLMANPSRIPHDERFISELTGIFLHSKYDDNRVRQYLALAMGRTGNERFVEPLVKAVPEEKSENLYAIIYALGMLRDKKAATTIAPYLDDPNPRIRLVSVIALGDIADPKSTGPLKRALHDPEPNVQWDAAIALAKMKDLSGRDILLKLLDREYLSKFPEIDLEEQNHILLVAIEAATHLNDSKLNDAILRLSQGDPNMNVRKAALAVAK